MTKPNQFDHYLNDAGPDKTPAALVLRECLMPVEGTDGVLFPPTFAAGDGFPGGYNIDGPLDGRNVCIVDTVGSQANRIEPMFAEEGYRDLVPQVVVRAGDKEVNLLEAGHRAGDAIVRCSALEQPLREAFRSLLKGDAEPLARIAPTSLVFGVWDSRDTQAKFPRLVSSTIRAFDVRKLTRSAQYNPPVPYLDDELLEEPGDLRDSENRVKTKHPFAQRGFTHVPASGTHGGVIAEGGVRRDATLGLAALRQLFVGSDEERTLALRRYVLGLALVALTRPVSAYLRQGCLLVRDPDRAKECEFGEVYPSGKRSAAKITDDDAIAFAKQAASAFGVGENRTVDFDKARAKNEVAGETDSQTAKKARKAKKTAKGAKE
jgi:CRISPR-associated protein Csb1